MLYQRVFVHKDQKRFAELSGDTNPLHIDPIQARRLLFGEPVVHGLHLLMWALDSLLATTTDKCRIRSLTASFRKPVFPGEQVTINFIPGTGDSVSLDITSSGEIKANFKVEFHTTQIAPDKAQPANPKVPPHGEPEALGGNGLALREGSLPLHLPQDRYQDLFPNLAHKIDPTQASTLLSISRLAGVVFQAIEYEIQLSDNVSGPESNLDYRVTAFDDRMQHLAVAMESPNLAGTMLAFVRPEAVTQATCAELDLLVQKDEFADQDALIVGASRGLGEVAAKLLTAGGATVTGTFNLGEDDSARVGEDIKSVGGDIRFVHLDVTQTNLADFIEHNSLEPTHLYYFGSPRVLDRTGAFSTKILEGLFRIYVTQFIQLVDVLAGLRLKRVFYPSHVALDDTPLNMREYSIAKSAGEMACISLEKTYADLRIYKPRLPRVSTDQTAGILKAIGEDAPPLMLNHLQQFSSI